MLDPYFRVQQMMLSSMRPSRPVPRRTRPKTAIEAEIERVDRRLRVERLDRAYAQRPRRQKTAHDIAREKDVRRRRWARATGRTYTPRVQRNAAHERRMATFRKIEAMLLDTRQRLQPGQL
jgi:hypothetical protein